jgi:HK97 family phage portal protein
VPLIYDPLGVPIEIAPGRGDLRYSSVPFGANTSPGVPLLGKWNVSYAQIFATQPWVAAAVLRMLTWAIRVPLKVYKRTGADSRQRLASGDHPVARAVVDPWERGSQADLIMHLLGPLLVHGNGVTEVMQGAGDVVRFDPIDWRFSVPIMPWFDTIAGWEITEDGQERTVGADSVMHLKYWSPMGPTGLSPLQQLGVTLSIEDAAQRYQQAMFSNGARPPSAVTVTSEFLGLEPTERQTLLQQLRDDITTLYTNPDNAGRPAILPPGLDWKPVGHTAVEAARGDQRTIAREEICAVYQIPPPMLGILNRATFSNIEVQREMAYTDALAPPLVLIEQTLNAQLLRGLLREDDVFVEFDFAGVLRGDRLKEIQALREAISIALLTPNEGRSVLNMPRSDDEAMDQFLVPANNLAPIGSLPGSGEDTTAAEGAADTPETADTPAAGGG